MPDVLVEVKGLPKALDPHPDPKTFEVANQVLSSSSETPTDPHMRMLSGIALYSAGDLERALHELRAASLLNEQLWPAAIYQGMCLESMGHPDLARAEYRHAVRVLEANPESYSVLPHELHGLGPDLFEMARRKSGSPGVSPFQTRDTKIQ
jgi:tetratricopeptide (TPR) repeat protein